MGKFPGVYIIAEAGVNHNGSVEKAKRLIEVAADAGANAVKFQTFRADKFISKNAAKADYQKETTDEEESQLEMIKKLELDEEAHKILIEHSVKKGIHFLSTPFDLESVDFLANKLNLPLLKISSGDITNGPLLLKAARTDKPVILSTGMSTMEEVKAALGILAFGYLGGQGKPSLNAFSEAYHSVAGKDALKDKVVLLHCTTEYPADIRDINLLAMQTLGKEFSLTIGYSDHSLSLAVPLAAVALGAVIIEKHFTLDKNLPGPDHKASMQPEELKEMVKLIRQVELALGSADKMPTAAELKNRLAARKSIVTVEAINKGEKFTEENLTTKRPGDGISPMNYWEWLGKKANKNYAQDERVSK